MGRLSGCDLYSSRFLLLQQAKQKVEQKQFVKSEKCWLEGTSGACLAHFAP